MRKRPVSFYPLTALLTVCLLTMTGCIETVERSRPAPVTQLGVNLDSATGAVMVRRGDTVWQIAKRYNLSSRDIIDANGLMPPYKLAEGRRLILPAPMEHKVGGHDTLFRVARMYSVPLNDLVRVNNLSSPYRLNVGQRLRIPSTVARAEQERADEQLRDDMVAAKWDKQADLARLEAPSQPIPAPTAMPQRPLTQLSTATTNNDQAAYAPSSSWQTSRLRSDFIWPLRGQVVSRYGAKPGGLYNDGVNISAPKGTPVLAAADGAVVYVGNSLDSYGNLVLVRHRGGIITAYAHLDKAKVSRGMRVTKGQHIGTVGNSGTVANSQLHFEIRKGSETLDPQSFLG